MANTGPTIFYSPDIDEEERVQSFHEGLKYRDERRYEAYNMNFRTLEIKLYEKKESDIMRKIMLRYLWSEDPDLDFEIEDFSSIIRFQRFFETIQGFHYGSLDLSGRHESRYRQLMNRYTMLSADVLELAACIIPEPSPSPSGEPTDDKLSHLELLDRFNCKWNTKKVPFGFLLKLLSSTQKYIARNPEPIFQKILLQRLPFELHHCIMQLAGLKRSLRLGSTCTLFRTISLLYIYRERTFDLRIRPYDELVEACQQKGPDAAVEQIIKARDKMLEEMDFMIERPHAIKRFKTLKLSRQRCYIFRTLIQTMGGTLDEDSIFAPVEQRHLAILENATNVEDLCFSFLTLTEGVAAAATSLKKLQRLDLCCCELSQNFTLPPCPSVVTAIVRIFLPNQLRSWSVLASCTQIRYLAFCSSVTPSGSLPDGGVMSRFNPFRTLERLMMSGLASMDIPILTSWIRNARTLSLTHIKLQANEQVIFKSETRELIRALQGSPLQVLALDGIRNAEPSLLEEIGSWFPNLIALTLLYRDSDSQPTTKPTRWPRPSWEYAVALSRFSSLQYFGWNYIFNNTFYEICNTFCLFEKDFVEDHPIIGFEDEENRDTNEPIARLLAAHCPTLQIYGAIYEPDMPDVYRISREKEDWIDVERYRGFPLRDYYSPKASEGDWVPWELTELPTVSYAQLDSVV